MASRETFSKKKNTDCWEQGRTMNHGLTILSNNEPKIWYYTYYKTYEKNENVLLLFYYYII